MMWQIISPGCPLQDPPFRFVAYAIKRYPRGSKHLEVERARNLLYRALELVEPPGRRQTFKERMSQRDRGRKTITLKQTRKPWHLITAEIGLKDNRSTKRIYKKTTKEKQQLELDRAMKEILDEESVQPRST